MHVGRPVQRRQRTCGQPAAATHPEPLGEPDTAAQTQAGHVGAQVVGVVRGVPAVVGVRVQVQHGVRTALGERGEHVQQARQHLARLVAAVRQDHEPPGQPDGGLGALAVAGRPEHRQVHAVRLVLDRDGVPRRDRDAVAAHGDRQVHVAEHGGPVRGQPPVGPGTVDGEVQDHRHRVQVHQTADLRGDDLRHPGDVREQHDRVGPAFEEVGVQGVRAEVVPADGVQGGAVPAASAGGLPAHDVHVVPEPGEPGADEPGDGPEPGRGVRAVRDPQQSHVRRVLSSARRCDDDRAPRNGGGRCGELSGQGRTGCRAAGCPRYDKSCPVHWATWLYTFVWNMHKFRMVDAEVPQDPLS